MRVYDLNQEKSLSPLGLPLQTAARYTGSRWSRTTSAFLILPPLPVPEVNFQASVIERWGFPHSTQPPPVAWRLCGGHRAAETAGDLIALAVLHKREIPHKDWQAEKTSSYCPSSTVYSAPKVGCHSEKSVPLSPSCSMTWFRDFDCGKEQAVKQIVPTLFPQNWLHLQQNMEKFKTKNALKNSEGCGTKQLERDSIH